MCAIQISIALQFKSEFFPTREHRAVLVFRGGFSDNISNADPFYSEGSARSLLNPKIVFSQPLDEEEDSKLSSDLVNQFIRKSHEILDSHPINIKRARKGLFSANIDRKSTRLN